MDTNSHAVIRAWAKTQGLEVPKRGPLPKTVIDAYWAYFDELPVTQP